MAEETLSEVFIKEMHESGIDKVYYVQNLPKRFIYEKVPKMIQRYDRDGYTDGTLTVDPSGERVDALLDGLEISGNGDGSVVFLVGRESGKRALLAIDTYVAGTLPRDVVIPKRVSYPMDPTDQRSSPKPKSLIPVVELPVSRVVEAVSPEAKASPLKATRTLTEAQRQAARERLARAREIKKAQINNKMNAPSENV
jgi:hypothetical protein